MESASAPRLAWAEGDVPVATAFDDPYFALSDGAAETAHVFIAGNALHERLRPGFHVAELGFGTGLNLAETLLIWGGPGRIRFTTFEAFPMAPDQMRRALARWPGRAEALEPVIAALGRGETRVETDRLAFRLIPGDARETLPAWGGRADAWFLDGFSPARNPELWEPALMAEVARHTASGGTFATYTAAGHVRRALAAAGFTVTRAPGFGTKRHMTRGTRA